MKVKIKTEGNVPTYKTSGSSGFDISATERVTILPGSIGIVGTGLFVEVPDGYEMQVRSRSGLAYQRGIFVLNSPGTIDSDYRGEIKVILANFSTHNFTAAVGDRIAQGVIMKVEKAEFEIAQELEETERAEGGFGSTGI